MKILKFGVLLSFVILLSIGCGKQSGLEGKIVDGKGQPIANVKVVASQVQPIKGYEQFEATTSSDGTFRFGKLFPSSEYVLFPWSDTWSNVPMMTVLYDPTNLRATFYKGGWTADKKMMVQSGPEGETMILPSPMIIKKAIFTLEGKIVNGRGQPFANLKVVAKQVQPIKGYEKFEMITEADGTYRFDKLCPDSQYILTLQEDSFFSTMPITVKPGMDEEIRKHQTPLIMRFLVSSDDAIRDSKTDLEWAVGPDHDTDYSQAVQWVAACRLAGGGWRMPMLGELSTLLQPGIGKRNMDLAFKTTGYYVWSELKDSLFARYFLFVQGDGIFNRDSVGLWENRLSSTNYRAFGVRSRLR